MWTLRRPLVHAEPRRERGFPELRRWAHGLLDWFARRVLAARLLHGYRCVERASHGPAEVEVGPSRSRKRQDALIDARFELPERLIEVPKARGVRVESPSSFFLGQRR